MFSDYRKYLLRIRNNLIQCGVEFPVERVSSYRDVFELGCELDEVLWYYSVLAVSGSVDALQGFFLPLNGYYKERLRTLTYKEFADFLKDYDKISVSGKLKSKKALDKLKAELESSSKKYGNMVKLSEIGEGVGVSHGRYVEDVEESGRVAEEPKGEFVDHGRYVDETEGYLEDDEPFEFAEEGIEDEEPFEFAEDDNGYYDIDEEPFEFADEGEVYVEDDEEPFEFADEEEYFNTSDEDEEPFEFADEDEEPFEIIEEDEEPFEFADEDEVYEEDEEPFEFADEDEEPFEFAEDNEVYEEDEEPFEFAEDDGYVEEDEEPFEFAEDEEEYVEDDEPFEFAEDDQGYEEDEEPFEFVEDDEPFEFAEDEDDFVEDEEPFEFAEEEEVPTQSRVVAEPQKSPSDEVPQRDLSDTLQDFTNGFLTSVKRAAVKGFKKLEK